MAYLSEHVNFARTNEFEKEILNCCICGKEISKGGMWAMQEHHIGICKDCAHSLLELYIDTLLDSGEISEENDVESMIRLSNDILDRYKDKKEKKEKLNKNHM